MPPTKSAILWKADDARYDTWEKNRAVRTYFQKFGVFMARMVHSCALCMPSRATIATGQYAINHSVTDGSHLSPQHGGGECTWERTIARMLNEARGPGAPDGAFTGHCGKFCNGIWYANVPGRDGVRGSDGKLTIPPGYTRFIQTDPSTNDPASFTYSLFENGREYLYGSGEPARSLPNYANPRYYTIAPGLGLGSRDDNDDLVGLPSSTGHSGPYGLGDLSKSEYDTWYKQDVLRIKCLKMLEEAIYRRIHFGQPFFLDFSMNSPHIGSGQADRWTGNHTSLSQAIKLWNPTISSNFHVIDHNPTNAAQDKQDALAGAFPDSDAHDQESKRRNQALMTGVYDDTMLEAQEMLITAGLWEETLQFFFGDNGLASGDDGIGGGKQDRDEASSNVGCWVLGPEFGLGTSPAYAQGVNYTVCSTADIAPTILDLFNRGNGGAVVHLAGGVTQFDGQSLLDPTLSANRCIPLFDTQGGPGNGTQGGGFRGIVWSWGKYVELACGAGDLNWPTFPSTGRQYEAWKWGDNLDPYVSTIHETVNGVDCPAQTINFEMELDNLMVFNNNAGVAVDPDPVLRGGVHPSPPAIASVLAAAKAATLTLWTAQGNACRVTIP